MSTAIFIFSRAAVEQKANGLAAGPRIAEGVCRPAENLCCGGPATAGGEPTSGEARGSAWLPQKRGGFFELFSPAALRFFLGLTLCGLLLSGSGCASAPHEGGTGRVHLISPALGAGESPLVIEREGNVTRVYRKPQEEKQ